MKSILVSFIVFICCFSLSAQNNLDTFDRYPIYRGCSKALSNAALKKCTDEKVSNFIKLGFNYELADKLFPQNNSTRFFIEFIINEKGKPEDINVRANSKPLAIDIIKLIKRLPKLKKPGYKNGNPIKVPFKLLMTVYFE